VGTAAGQATAGNAAADLRARAFARLAEEVCQARDPAEIARGCAALRDHALEEIEQGKLAPAAGREICRAVDGVGLGLYIVEQIVRAHHGSIEARSSKEEGATFTVVLPRKARRRV
jgi:hypothetical protein